MSEAAPSAAPAPSAQHGEPVAWEVHFCLQAQFVELATLLGVSITDCTSFVQAVELCRATALAAAIKAKQFEEVTAHLDGCLDAINYVMPCVSGIYKDDLRRAQRQLELALALLRKLGK